METFEQYYESCTTCNVSANELDIGDSVENINPDCDHYRSKGVVVAIDKVEQDDDRTAGNLIVYRCHNSHNDFDPEDINGKFREGDVLKKTEIQLRKI